MKILLTNDDGIEAVGLHILGRELAQIAEIYVVSPEQEQSGAGHGITVRRPLYALETSLPFARAAWAVAGLPADCVKLALEELFPNRPDLVVSGINNGGNLGTDIIYSGTVSAAMEGFLYGLPALAVSATKRDGNFWAAAEFARELIGKWQRQNFKPRTLLNVNVPGREPGDIVGWRYTNMGWRWYTDVFSKQTDEEGRDYYWLGGQAVPSGADGSTDVEACAAGYISVSPLNFDLTNYQMLKELQAGEIELM